MLRRLTCISTTASLIIVLLPGLGRATLTLDQVNVYSTAGSFVAFSSVSGELAQTFTVGLSGLLAQFDLEVFTGKSSSSVVTIRLLGTTGGVPDPSNVLATFTEPGTSFPDIAFSAAPPLASFSLGSAAFAVSAGDLLAITLSDVYEDSSDAALWVTRGNLPAPDYSGGQLFLRSLSDGSFRVVTTEEGHADAGFRTWVDIATSSVPEPGVLTLLGSGLAILGLLRHRRHQRR